MSQMHQDELANKAVDNRAQIKSLLNILLEYTKMIL